MSIFVLLMLLLNNVFASVNIARDKEVRFCTDRVLDSGMTDGIKINSTVAVYDTCDPEMELQIILGRDFLINYFIVYEGSFNVSGTLDYFSAYVEDSEGEYYCSNYTKRSIGPSETGMRVNCFTQVGRKLSLVMQSSVGFSIAELEVYTIGFTTLGDIDFIYHGCFRSINITSIEKNKYRENCIKQCIDNGVALAAFKNISTCFCANDVSESERLPLDQCDNKHLGEYFGGTEAYSVYIAFVQLPYFEGCFNASKPAQFSGEMSIDKCLRECGRVEFYALGKGQECSCLDDIDDINYLSPTLCDMSCSGNPDDICGGEGYLSIYRGGIMTDLPTIVQCATEYDSLGICKDGCKPNFIGDFCYEVNVTYCVNFDPCIRIPNTDCVSINSTYECVCKSGYETDSNGTCTNGKKYCINNDLCANFPNTECVIIKSSQTCQCKYGFSNSTGICMRRDDDKCVSEPCAEIPNTDCVSIDSTYKCVCKSGYETDSNGTCTNRKKLCINNDLCADFPNTECVIINSSQTCQCKYGFSNSTGMCKYDDDDKCFSEPCTSIPNTLCVTINSTYKCVCKSGYEFDSSQTCQCKYGFSNSTGMCRDEDKCVSEPCIGIPNTDCVSINSTYKCVCKSGYQTDLRGRCTIGTKLCINNDLCVDYPNTVCVIIDSSQRCKCIYGFSSSTGMCKETLLENPTSSDKAYFLFIVFVFLATVLLFGLIYWICRV